LKGLLFAATLLFISTSAWATTVTSGFVSTSVNSDFEAQYRLTGDNVTLNCVTFLRCGSYQAGFSGPFTTVADLGTPVSLDSRFSVTDFIAAEPSTNLTLNGTTYRTRGTFDFTVGTVVRAPVVTAPFTFAGDLDLLHPTTLAHIGDLTLTGRGTATATFDPFTARTLRFDFTSPPPQLGDIIFIEPSMFDGVLRQTGLTAADLRGQSVTLQPMGGGFLARPITLSFNDNAQPVLINPEPASVTLVGTGLGGLWWLSRKRRWKSSQGAG
jgi:hypothetical protein